MVYDYLKTTFILCKKEKHRHKYDYHLDRLHVKYRVKSYYLQYELIWFKKISLKLNSRNEISLGLL